MFRFFTKYVPATMVAGSLLLSVAAMPTHANAQTVCGKRDDIIKQLKVKYGETRRTMGVQQGRGVVEMYASAETGSWTILVTDPRGMTCLMAAGEAFEADAVAEVDTPT
ncbi:MAG: hypothetical protein AAF557_05475 [Pseudomonadota bacterium]